MHVWIAVLLTVSACWGETASNEVWNVKRLSPRLSLQWKYDKDSIEMTMIGETKGWIGIGFAPTRAVTGVDFIVGGVRNGMEYVYDCYTTRNGHLIVDAEQNVDILDGFENATHTTVTVRRPLKSGNVFDKTIEAGNMEVFWVVDQVDIQVERNVVKFHNIRSGNTEIDLLRRKDQSGPAVAISYHSLRQLRRRLQSLFLRKPLRQLIAAVLADSIATEATIVTSTSEETTTSVVNGSENPQSMVSLEHGEIAFSYNVLLDEMMPVNFYWDFDETAITMQVIAPTKGWVGLGFSRTTSMNGADIIMMGVKSGEAYALDCHADRNGVPDVDQEQNVEIISGWENDTHTGVTIRRNRLMCNSEDMDIESGTYKVIWAYGKSDLSEAKPHFGHYHGFNRGGKSLKLINRIASKRSSKKNVEPQVIVGPSNYLVPAKSTYYLCQYAKISEANETVYITGYFPYITKGNERNVHHMIIHLCDVDVSPEQLARSYECYEEITPYSAGCSKSIGGWAIGGSGSSYPADSGIPIGGYSHPQYAMIEMHYDNPEGKEFRDSSGMQISYVRERPRNMIGLFNIQHAISTIWIPPGHENLRLNGYCRESCLNRAMEGAGVDEVKMFGVLLHSHLAGTAMRLRHFRNGTELKAVVSDQHYDFNYQEVQYFEEPVLLKAGDSLALECGYSTLDRKKITPGGLPTSSEMCLAFILHYPALPVSMCASRGSVLENFDVLAKGLNVTFKQRDVRRVRSEISNNFWKAMEIISEKLLSGVVWDNEKRRFAQEFIAKTKQFVTCHHESTPLVSFFKSFTPPKIGEYVDMNPSCPST